MQLAVRINLRNRWLHVLAITCLIVARRPDALFHPQFWAEDGAFWYQDAYNDGLLALLHPSLGYLQTLSRLTALIAVQFPLALAPAIYAVIALYFQVLPASILLSKRLDQDIQSWPGRIALAYFYALVPNSYEWNMNITNAQWHLALAAFLMIISTPSDKTKVRYFDAIAVLLSGLSGPFSVFYAPFSIWEYWRSRARQSLVNAILTVSAAAVQALCLLTTISTRPAVHLDIGFSALCKILAHQIILGGLFGARLTGALLAFAFWGSSAASIFLTLGAAALGLIAFRFGPLLYRKMLLFVALLLGSALLCPTSQSNTWDQMAHLGNCDRYFIAPILVWFSTILVLIGSKTVALRLVAMTLIAPAFFGVWLDWTYPPYFSTRFTALATQFSVATPGTKVTFPENPQGWSMTLTKRNG